MYIKILVPAIRWMVLFFKIFRLKHRHLTCFFCNALTLAHVANAYLLLHSLGPRLRNVKFLLKSLEIHPGFVPLLAV